MKVFHTHIVRILELFINYVYRYNNARTKDTAYNTLLNDERQKGDSVAFTFFTFKITIASPMQFSFTFSRNAIHPPLARHVPLQTILNRDHGGNDVMRGCRTTHSRRDATTMTATAVVDEWRPSGRAGFVLPHEHDEENGDETGVAEGRRNQARNRVRKRKRDRRKGMRESMV